MRGRVRERVGERVGGRVGERVGGRMGAWGSRQIEGGPRMLLVMWNGVRDSTSNTAPCCID